jgi:hypothetical protein
VLCTQFERPRLTPWARYRPVPPVPESRHHRLNFLGPSKQCFVTDDVRSFSNISGKGSFYAGILLLSFKKNRTRFQSMVVEIFKNFWEKCTFSVFLTDDVKSFSNLSKKCSFYAGILLLSFKKNRTRFQSMVVEIFKNFWEKCTFSVFLTDDVRSCSNISGKGYFYAGKSLLSFKKDRTRFQSMVVEIFKIVCEKYTFSRLHKQTQHGNVYTRKSLHHVLNSPPIFFEPFAFSR